MAQPLLENGEDTQPDVGLLLRKIDRLEGELQDAKQSLADARKAAAAVMRAQAMLRQQLEPMYGALRMIFGELNAAGVGEAPVSSQGPSPRTTAVWESWKQRLGGGTAKVIDALLLHGEMNTTQLSIATGLHRTTIPALIFKLNKASLLNKNGGKFSLKEL